MKTTITVQSIKPPNGSQKSGCITTTAGEKFWLWASKLGTAKIGATYEVIFEENKGFNNISTMTEVEGSAAASRSPSQPAPPTAAPFRTPEQMSVTEIVCAYIKSGKCANPSELRRAMQEAQNAFRATWPETDYAQAAE